MSRHPAPTARAQPTLGAQPQTHTLMPLLADPGRLKHAARACMRTGSSPGADGVTWRAYRDGLDSRLATLARRLRDGTWRPGPVRVITWPSDGKQLTTAIPTVEDRIIHRAVRNCLEPILEAYVYPEWMFGWRPRRTRLDAIVYALRYWENEQLWVADVDVATATSGGEVGDVVGWVARWVHDGGFLRIVRQALAGLPSPLAPGSGLTPLLTNLRLAPVDAQLGHLNVVRVTDNYAVLCPSRPAAEFAYRHVVEALATAGLAPNRRKSKVWQPNPEDLFLGG